MLVIFYNSKSTVRVPSLNKVLEVITNKNKSINIELKPNKGFERLNVDKIGRRLKFFPENIFFSSLILKVRI